MDCPKCGRYLGEGMLPARCPHCGENLANPTDSIRGSKAQASRKNVEGLTGIGKGNTQGKKRHYLQVFAAVVLVVAFGGLLYYATKGFGTISALTVPDVVGWRVERAEEELNGLGYVTVVENVPSTDGTSGLVVAQDPPAGTERPAYSEVVIQVSTSLIMPEIVGKPWAEVRPMLDEAGIHYEVAEQLSDEVDDTVISANIAPGAALGKDDVVQIVVAKRPQVPDLKGKTPDQAQEELVVSHLKLATEDVIAKEGETQGLIVSQDPPAGSSVDAGTTVLCRVARSAEEVYTNSANAVLHAIYDIDPSGDAIGTALSPLLSEDNPSHGASPHDIWWNVVKRGGRYANQPQELQSLKRSLVSDDLQVDPATGKVTATVTVNWDWSGLPDAGAPSSEDTREVTMEFDDDGKLVSFYDEQTDVPFFNVAT